MRSLSLDQLRAFLTVSEAGSFSAAARRLNLTQPAVSQQIKELEGRLGVRLLDRLGKKAFPTPAGEDLRTHARLVLEQERQTIDAMRAHRDGALGRIRLGSSAALCAFLLPPVLVDLRQRYPSLEVRIGTGPTMAMVRQVLANEIDIVFATGPLPPQDPVLEIRAVLPGTFLALWPDFLGPAPAAVTPYDLAGKPFVSFTPGNLTHDLVQRWFAASGVKPSPITEIDIGPNIVALVRAGVGSSILSPDVALWLGNAANVVVRPTEPRIPHEVLVITRRDKPRDRALRIVHDALLALGEAQATLGMASSI